MAPPTRGAVSSGSDYPCAYPRIYHPQPLTDRAEIALSEDAANHVGRVLRMSAGQALQLFDGSNQVFDAEIVRVDKRACWCASATAAWTTSNRRSTCIWAR